jgi:hypothetical protein
VHLYVADGTPVIAIEAGYVVKLGLFTGATVGTPWWNETWAVLIEGAHGGICYGEIQPAAWLRESLTLADVSERSGLMGLLLWSDRPNSSLGVVASHRARRRSGCSKASATSRSLGAIMN